LAASCDQTFEAGPHDVLEVVTLERLAARDRSSVSDVLARQLRDLVSEHSGFAETFAWPAPPYVLPLPR
jgi:hypothetical protein